MRKILSIVFCFALCSASHAAGDKLQTALDQARAKNGVSAMQMTIIMPHKAPMTIVSGHTTKDKEASAITSTTLFQIGSNTKSFTSAALLKLEEAGKLKLSTQLKNYYPQYKQWGNVTLSQLLHNNSGIPSYSRDKTFQKDLFTHPEKKWTDESLIAVALTLPIEFKPGNGWSYSNTNFILAGMIAEKASGKPISELFQEYFFSPSALDLSSTYYSSDHYPAEVINRMAHGYNEHNRDITEDNMSWARTAGAIVSNSSDLAKWGHDLFHGKVLSKESLQKMMTMVSTTTGKNSPELTEGYGLAIGTRVTKNFGRWWGHEGETLGYHAIFMWFPEHDIVIAINTNGEARHLREFAESVPGLVGVQPLD